MADVAKLDTKSEVYFKLYSIMVEVDNLDIDLGDYFKLSFIRQS
jgi:hypothetical protein